RRHTRLVSDWSSDVCSSDLERRDEAAPGGPATETVVQDGVPCRPLALPEAVALAFQLQPRLRTALESIEQAARRQDIVRAAFLRSEERRVGKECRARGGRSR